MRTLHNDNEHSEALSWAMRLMIVSNFIGVAYLILSSMRIEFTLNLL